MSLTSSCIHNFIYKEEGGDVWWSFTNSYIYNTRLGCSPSMNMPRDHTRILYLLLLHSYIYLAIISAIYLP